MRNIEKYKNNIESDINVCGLYKRIYKIKNGEYPYDCCSVCDRCYDDCIRWLAEEFKEPVLDEVERKYLSDVIKPFREKIECIFKAKLPNLDEYYIIVGLKDNDSLRFPCFKGNTMYKGMEVDKEYELEELGL